MENRVIPTTIMKAIIYEAIIMAYIVPKINITIGKYLRYLHGNIC